MKSFFAIVALTAVAQSCYAQLWCPPPKCPRGCQIQKVHNGPCPRCDCSSQGGPKNCPSVECSGLLCHTTRGSDGCLKCVCEFCPPPKCDPGCELQTDVAQGQCSTCVCPSYNDNDGDQDEGGRYCPNLFCSDYGCREVPGPAGCPICMCDPFCATPKCKPGCQIVTNKYMGRCPVCICSSPMESDVQSPNHSVQVVESHDSIKNVQQPIQQEQSQVTFSGLVEPVVAEQELVQSTMYTTITVDMETTTEMTTSTCPAAVCSGLKCSYATDKNGCKVCKCRYKCPKPKCVGSCYAETNAPSHRCPGCVCPSTRIKFLVENSTS